MIAWCHEIIHNNKSPKKIKNRAWSGPDSLPQGIKAIALDRVDRFG